MISACKAGQARSSNRAPTGSYPTGVTISDEQLAHVPITRHDWHAEWNYTVHPTPTESADYGDSGHPPATRQGPDRTWLRAPVLTGLTPAQRDELIEKLGVARHAQREILLHDPRGSARSVAAGTGCKAALSLGDRVAITLLDLRYSIPKQILEDLFEVSRTTSNKVIKQTKPLLTLIGHTPEPADIHFTSPAEVTQFAAAAGAPVPAEIKAACY